MPNERTIRINGVEMVLHGRQLIPRSANPDALRKLVEACLPPFTRLAPDAVITAGPALVSQDEIDGAVGRMLSDAAGGRP